MKALAEYWFYTDSSVEKVILGVNQRLRARGRLIAFFVDGTSYTAVYEK
jgi:hypothetical protein